MPIRINDRFGKLVVKNLIPINDGSRHKFLCQCVCDCGAPFEIKDRNLRFYGVNSCGCGKTERMEARANANMIGRRFGRLVVLKKSNPPRVPGVGGDWDCRCDCGVIKSVSGNDMRHGKTESCGCLRAEQISRRVLTHGATRHSDPRHHEYVCWGAMKTRCSNPNQRGAKKYYQDHGITVAEEWLHDFEAFYAHIGPAPTKKHTVDRINPWGNYEPGNVRWADAFTQARNTRNFHHRFHPDSDFGPNI